MSLLVPENDSKISWITIFLVTMIISDRCIAARFCLNDFKRNSNLQYEFPVPIFGQTSSLAVGMNDDGEMDEMLHLLGGCTSPYISTRPITGQEDEQFAQEYLCPDLSDMTFLFDAKNHTTKRLRVGKPMPRKRHRHTSTAVDRYIWALGGRDENNQVRNEIDIYDSIAGTWTTLGEGLDSIKMNDPSSSLEDGYAVSDHVAFVFGEFILITGGFDKAYNAVGHTIVINTVQSMEKNSLVYFLKSSLNIPRGSGAGVSHANFAVIVGGFSNEDGFCEAMKSVEIYDVKTDSWSIMPNELNVGRANLNLIYYEGKVLALGGETRGILDRSSGRCLDEYQMMDSLTLGTNIKLPNRLTFPIDTSRVEVWDGLVSGGQHESVKWSTVKSSIANDGKLKSSIYSYPSISTIFVFGGIWYDFDLIESEQPDQCSTCFTMTSDIDAFTIIEMTQNSFLAPLVIMTMALISLIFIYRFTRRKLTDYSSNKDVLRFNERGKLMRNSRVWGGDAFAFEEDEEVQFGHDAFSIKMDELNDSKPMKAIPELQ